MPNEETVLLFCEMEQKEVIEFLELCDSEGVSSSEKVTQIIENFLPRGDNHLLKKTA